MTWAADVGELDPDHAGRGPGGLERDHPAVVREQTADSIGPFDQANTVAGPVVGDAEVFKGSRTLEPVRVEVVNGQAAFVLVNQDERGTRDGRRIDAQGFGDGPREPRLARTERTRPAR